MNVPFGVANSISANFSYDAFDAIKFAEHHLFEIIQIYLDESILYDIKKGELLAKKLSEHRFHKIFFHLKGNLNPDLICGEYFNQAVGYCRKFDKPSCILHFDENASLEDTLKVTEGFSQYSFKIYLENYFELSGKGNAEKNMRKYQALFTLANSQENILFPILDIPRFYHKNLELPKDEALNWTYQLFNYFGNRRMPIMLHLIDCEDSSQNRNQYCSIGEGYIPYQKIFEFLNKTRTALEGIIFEYEDKINPLKSREKLIELFKNYSD